MTAPWANRWKPQFCSAHRKYKNVTNFFLDSNLPFISACNACIHFDNRLKIARMTHDHFVKMRFSTFNSTSGWLIYLIIIRTTWLSLCAELGASRAHRGDTNWVFTPLGLLPYYRSLLFSLPVTFRTNSKTESVLSSGFWAIAAVTTIHIRKAMRKMLQSHFRPRPPEWIPIIVVMARTIGNGRALRPVFSLDCC